MSKISGYGAQTPADADIVLGDHSGSTCTFVMSAVSSYVIGNLVVSSSASPTSGDSLVAVHSGAAKLYDLDALSAYAVNTIWSPSAGAAAGGVSGDVLLIDRSTTPYTLTIDLLQTFVLTGLMSTVATDIAALGSATLGSTDYILVVQMATPKQVTLADLETKLWADHVTHIDGLSHISSTNDGDKIWTTQTGTEKYTTPADLAAYNFLNSSYGAAAILASAWSAATVTSPNDSDTLLLNSSGTRKQITAANFATYALSAVVEAPGQSPPSSGDEFIAIHNNGLYTESIDDVSAYIIVALYNFSAITTPNSSDYFPLLQASDTSKIITFSALKASVLAGLTGTMVAAVFGTSAGTLSTSDNYLLLQSGVPVNVELGPASTAGTLEAKLFGDFDPYVWGLTDVSTLAGTEKFYVATNSTTPKSVLTTDIATFVLTNATYGLSGSGSALQSGSGGADWVTGDQILFNRSGIGLCRATIDDLVTYIGSTTLTTGSIGPTTNFVLAASNAPANEAVFGPVTAHTYTSDGSVIYAVVTAFQDYVASFTPASSVGATDLFYKLTSGTTAVSVSAENIAAYAWLTYVPSITPKATPTGADLIVLQNAASSNALVTATITNVVTTAITAAGTGGNAALKLTKAQVAVDVSGYAATAGGYTALPTAKDTVEIQGVTSHSTWGWLFGSAGAAGDVITLIETAGYAGLLFPFAGGTINGLTATTGSITITAHHVYVCRCTAANTWFINDSGALPQS